MRHIILLSLMSILFFVGCGSSSDQTFMGVCRVDNAYRYPVGGVGDAQCDHPVEHIVWAIVPLKVHLASELSDYDESLEEAVDFWDRELDVKLFVITNDVETADIFIVQGDAGKPGLAATHHEFLPTASGERLAAIVEIRKPGDVTEMLYVMAHELGHAVGLGHDPQDRSIMNGTIENVGIIEGDPFDPDDPTPAFPYYEVTANDRNALHDLYL